MAVYNDNCLFCLKPFEFWYYLYTWCALLILKRIRATDVETCKKCLQGKNQIVRVVRLFIEQVK